ncbi:dihydrolipoyl dehydrogenase [Staphylococcus pseudintermedius]|uniref:Dihydrolipoyl dehydrogenase n=2 Tax=Staphylococcus pseudintermedius TaxID=283734 RepID=A0A161UCJ1_STAPS|nr:dihydrolipoyl dehydrogenase [Staphylococcus pseudintermedius]ADV05333.1 Dihydrolipoamide dehydrogenase of pyruvate dehydrogenase complex [Staphylococcus pseudintermedius HKU10-03]ADX76950.1 pyruvate dehydrogenase complex E3 component, lipoamide dehydrogenase [Staphylococcus pseudintermedius ED99]ANQ82192.1 dihydrolipoyl dehydrogenase [Staphylococcus pseudintermedius]ANS89987.1 Dihydrolipoamide dehydrogenase of pyruvate dehydrogenase complex [Staphylococcus pseudintermedius]ASQ50959.1 dihydr
MVVGDFPIETDTIVIGAGPGGYVAAIRAAQLGQKVTIVEKGNLGGVCLNVGCIPSKALLNVSHRFEQAQHGADLGITAENVSLDFDKVQSFKGSVVSKLTGGVESLLKGNKVEIVRGEAYFVDEHSLRVMDDKSAQTYNFKNAIVATGSRPIQIPNFEFGGRILDSTGALNLQEVPKKLVVVGGGYIGSELGTAYANFGTEVTILEGAKEILGGFEKQMVAPVKKEMKAKGMIIETEALAKSAEETDNGVKVTYEVKGEEKTIEADYVLVTVGRRPNTDELGLEEVGVKLTDRGLVEVDKQSRTSVDSIYAIGDIVPGLPLAHKASYEAKVAAEAIAGQNSEVDYIGMPAVCFTEPELAQVGYTEAQAKEEGLDIKASKFPYQANGRALSLNDTNGFVKLVTLKEDDTLIGAQVVGTNASDVIAELGLAIEAGMNAEDIALTVHAHPTLGEMSMEAAEKALGLPIHTM